MDKAQPNELDSCRAITKPLNRVAAKCLSQLAAAIDLMDSFSRAYRSRLER
jgi:hypothetical protein